VQNIEFSFLRQQIKQLLELQIKDVGTCFHKRVASATLEDGDIITLGGAASVNLEFTPLQEKTKSFYVFQFHM
jgi:hypothetical protein